MQELAGYKIVPILMGALTATALRAQSLEIYSEFQRVDPFGSIVAVDRAERPREILSPAVPRNGYASFHVVVSVPPKTNYLLYVVTNPLDACRVALYKEHFVKTGGGWIPDTLAEVHRLPDFGAMPDPDEDIPGQNTRAYLLDVWIPPTASPGRFRLEAQLKVGYWIVRPMEVRVISALRSQPVRRPGAGPGGGPAPGRGRRGRRGRRGSQRLHFRRAQPHAGGAAHGARYHSSKRHPGHGARRFTPSAGEVLEGPALPQNPRRGVVSANSRSGVLGSAAGGAVNATIHA